MRECKPGVGTLADTMHPTTASELALPSRPHRLAYRECCPRGEETWVQYKCLFGSPGIPDSTGYKTTLGRIESSVAVYQHNPGSTKGEESLLPNAS